MRINEREGKRARTFFNWTAAALLAGSAALSLVATARAATEEWPQWRGPKGDSIVREAGLLDKWPEGGPKKVWNQAVGAGFSSPIGFEGKVYLFSLAGSKETLTAFDAESGKPAWSQSYNVGKIADYVGTRATPTIVGDRIYTYGSAGMLVGRTLADGKELWRLDVLKETGSEMLAIKAGGWGEASSPLVVGDAVYVQGGETGPAALAVDKNTGKVLWKSEAQGPAGTPPSSRWTSAASRN